MSVSLYGSGQTVLQVVSAQYNTQIAQGATTPFVSTPLTVNITPQSTTSKILVRASFPCQVGSSNALLVTLYRGTSTNLALSGGVYQAFAQLYAGSSSSYTSVPVEFLDSPSITSTTAYSVYVSAPGSTATLFPNGTTGTITVMEISGS